MNDKKKVDKIVKIRKNNINKIYTETDYPCYCHNCGKHIDEIKDKKVEDFINGRAVYFVRCDCGDDWIYWYIGKDRR